jgi:hypothetical protein
MLFTDLTFASQGCKLSKLQLFKSSRRIVEFCKPAEGKYSWYVLVLYQFDDID